MACLVMIQAVDPNLFQVHLKVEAKFVRDVLCGDETTEIRVKLIEIMSEQPPKED